MSSNMNVTTAIVVSRVDVILLKIYKDIPGTVPPSLKVLMLQYCFDIFITTMFV